jgi:hypothetical protein
LAVRTAIGPLGVSLSVPALVRVATHPLGIRLLDGRSVATPQGSFHARAGATPTSLIVRCAPCLIDSPLLAARPVRIEKVEASVEHGESNQLRGTLRAGRVAGASARRASTSNSSSPTCRWPTWSPCSARRCRKRRAPGSKAVPVPSCACRYRRGATRSSRASTA